MDNNNFLEDSHFIRVISVGSFCHADLYLHQPTGTYFILKVMPKHRIMQLNQIEHIKNERDILVSISHPNIVQVYGTFQDECNFYIVLEYIPGGDVFIHLRTMVRFDVDVARFYAAEILLAIQYLHRSNIVYRDLKPENLVFTSNGHVKLIDFGFAKQIEDRTYSLCGTPEYMAPELLSGQGASFCSDWWSFGILIYEFLVGSTPFYDQNEKQIYINISSGQFEFPEFLDETSKSLISGLLQVDPTFRLGTSTVDAEDLKSHPWFKSINWEKIFHQKYKPPLIPTIHDPDDNSKFPDYSDSSLYAELFDAPPVDFYISDW